MAKSFKVKGFRYNDLTSDLRKQEFNVIISNDKIGKTLSIDDGVIQYTISMNNLLKYLK